VQIYGRSLTRLEIEARAGTPSQFAGVRLMTLGDGLERGIRLLEFRSGTGLRFTVLVDRAMDIGDCEFQGMAIGWNSPSGFRGPGISDSDAESGLGWLRSFSGLITSCGLDHIFLPAEEDAAHFNYVHRKRMTYPLHGRLSNVPARLTGYGERWEADECILWCEGIVQQAAMFGENLHLIRRYEINAGSDEIRMTDRVVNRGFARTPHMLLYHIDVGYPLLDEGSRFVAPVKDVLMAGHLENYQKQGVGYRTMAGPKPNYAEQVWEFDMAEDAGGRVPIALINDRLGLGFVVETSKSEFPCHVQWQNLQEGMYTVGIEPCTNHILGRAYAKENGELIWLGHGEERSYHTTLRVLAGKDQIASSDKRIAAISKQPEEDYPQPSGRFPSLTSRKLA
jgi:hypothetical protein